MKDKPKHVDLIVCHNGRLEDRPELYMLKIDVQTIEKSLPHKAGASRYSLVPNKSYSV